MFWQQRPIVLPWFASLGVLAAGRLLKSSSLYHATACTSQASSCSRIPSFRYFSFELGAMQAVSGSKKHYDSAPHHRIVRAGCGHGHGLEQEVRMK
ncbi:hypothetical protein BCR41DRAFT_89397 [Lobosporangium transversale]|uniref:Uncharacterized protein n=1 Tax=Lobosporangium transversale TaxID=64571 RepID=A0A1Y2GKN5_9FUNG|nr:hypothetical protein BCR41DRAFT_89397 [Lobosporangium transversale]ORZ13823.1 hypothetical protein BCR41DRAFT_89397 [Lobosporangium transversale]|eukprot:XP_021880607.1 hypothetical protein BCR41DRAFT_89397 [Lobosporangium transversale]